MLEWTIPFTPSWNIVHVCVASYREAQLLFPWHYTSSSFCIKTSRVLPSQEGWGYSTLNNSVWIKYTLVILPRLWYMSTWVTRKEWQNSSCVGIKWSTIHSPFWVGQVWPVVVYLDGLSVQITPSLPFNWKGLYIIHHTPIPKADSNPFHARTE